MTQIESMELTAEQMDCMNNPAVDWLRMTPEQEEFIRAAGPDETCMFYSDAIIRLPRVRLRAIYDAAVRSAIHAGMTQIGATKHTNFQTQCDELELGQTFVRVTVTDDTGKSASCIGMIPDPRAH